MADFTTKKKQNKNNDASASSTVLLGVSSRARNGRCPGEIENYRIMRVKKGLRIANRAPLGNDILLERLLDSFDLWNLRDRKRVIPIHVSRQFA